MKRELFLTPEFCAVAEDHRLVEYIPENASDQAGAFLLGRVNRIMTSLRCAFVDIGRNRCGFLPLEENSGSFQGGKIASGDYVVVQIKKEETGEKGAFLTRDLTFPGKFVILMPLNRHIGVSSRIQEETVRNRLSCLGQEISSGAYGIVMRSASAHAEASEIRQEAETLFQQWEHFRQLAHKMNQPGLLQNASTHRQQLLNDYDRRGIDTIHDGEPLPVDLQRQLCEATLRRVILPHGGTIVLDRCEAMTVIDVNSASYTDAGNRQGTILETNLEACDIIVRQIRLRNISGMIVIDFINMDSETDQSLVLEHLRAACSQDRIKTVIHGFTQLGLVEMTRKRTRPDLYESETTLCATCGGNGRIRKKGMASCITEPN